MTKILLVEDDKSLREIYGVRLLAEGYDIVSAGDGEEALAMAIKERPQLIVSDVMMPKISGFDMLDILRSTTETKDIKVIMMTALSSEDQRLRGEQLGADRYLVKSQVGIEDVVRTVHDVLADVPTAAPTAQQAFGTPAPSAVPRPAPTAPPRPEATPPIPTPVTPAPDPAIAPAPVVAPAAPLPQPAPTIAPVQPIQPTPIATPTQPPQAVTPDPTTASAAIPTAVPPVTPAPAAPAPIAAPVVPTPLPTPGAVSGVQPDTTTTASSLPQPTAPFSTTRPASLGERVIHPLETPPETTDMSSRMAEELGAITSVPTPAAPSTPAAPGTNVFQTPPAPGQ